MNSHFGDPRNAPGLGEWTGVLTSAAVPLRLADEQVKTAKAGDSEAFGSQYMIAFDKGVIKLRHYKGYPNMSQTGGPWEDGSRDWKIPAVDGEYVAAWAVGGKGLWVKDSSGITHLIVKENLTEIGKWTLEQAAGGRGDMPAGVRAVLQLPPGRVEEKPSAEAPAAGGPVKPRHESAQSLFRRWQAGARTGRGAAARAVAGRVKHGTDGAEWRDPAGQADGWYLASTRACAARRIIGFTHGSFVRGGRRGGVSMRIPVKSVLLMVLY
jgi:hypothetical protein